MIQRFTLFGQACLLLAVTSLVSLPSFADSNDTVLLRHEGIIVTEADLNAYIQAQIPQRSRISTLAQPGKLREAIASLFILKVLAEEARDTGLHEEPDVQAEIALTTERILSARILEQRVEAQDEPDWEAVARDAYRSNPERFQAPERVRASHILLGLEERSEEQARELARELIQRAENGEDFEALAREYSDDPSVSRNGGDLGFFTREQVAPEFADAAFALSEPGDLSEPVATDFGIHIIRMEERREAGILPFEDVRQRLIEEARSNHANEIRRLEVERIRSLPNIEVNQQAVEALEQQYRDQHPMIGGNQDDHSH